MQQDSIRRFQAADTEVSLQPKTAGSLHDGVRAALSWSDELAAPIAAKLRASSGLACAEGCSHCCHLEVSASFPEVAHLATFALKTFSAEQLAALRERLNRRHAEDSGTRPATPTAGGRRSSCSLLVDGRCSAYEARPLACRGWNSADVEPCKQAEDSPHAPPSIPVHRILRDRARSVAEGIRDGVRSSGLDAAALELLPALRAVLADTDRSVAAWLSGERIEAGLVATDEPEVAQGEDGRWRSAVRPARGNGEPT